MASFRASSTRARREPSSLPSHVASVDGDFTRYAPRQARESQRGRGFGAGYKNGVPHDRRVPYEGRFPPARVGDLRPASTAARDARPEHASAAQGR